MLVPRDCAYTDNLRTRPSVMATDYKTIATCAIEKDKEELRLLSQEIWNNPELNFKEYKAAAALTSFLERKGFKVTRGYCGLETAFKAEYGGGGGANVCVICEYDALPEIGHACGHNLIAEAGVAAGLGLKAAIDAGLPGHVMVMGTPAEEDGGGKVVMVECGAFEGIDVAMMVHPGPNNILVPNYDACLEVTAVYTGKASHAAAFPWDGLNALDAAVAAYNSISVLRQQFRPSWQAHGIIRRGGVKPNIIPEETELYYFLRSSTSSELRMLKEKVWHCFESAGKATGCSVKIIEGPFYDNLLTNDLLKEKYKSNLKNIIKHDTEFYEPLVKMGSTDMGNVSHVVPSIHPEYLIGSGQEHYHTRDFTTVTNSIESHDATRTVAQSMCHTCIDVMNEPELLSNVKKEFEQEKSRN